MTSSAASGEDRSTLIDRLEALARGAAIILAGVPTTAFIPLPLTQAMNRRFEREEKLKRLHKMVEWARFCTERILGVRLDVAGEQNLPKPSRGHMYVSNHQSYVDIIVLMSVLDTVAFLSKKMIRYIPVIGRSAYCGGTVFFERGSKEARAKAAEETLRMCEQSTAVVVFPEGTRSDDGNLREHIHPGAIHGAFQRGLRVVPVAIDGTWLVFPKTMDRVRTGLPVAVRIGQVIDPGRFATQEEFATACWQAVRELFAEARGALRGASADPATEKTETRPRRPADAGKPAASASAYTISP